MDSIIKKYKDISRRIADEKKKQETSNTRRFFVSTIKIVTLRLALFFLHTSVVLFKSSEESFAIFAEHHHKGPYQRSLDEHRRYQTRFRLFSGGTAIAIISVSIILSLTFSLMFGSLPFAKAATYTWGQTSWIGGITANNANHASNQTGWTEYSATSTIITAGTELTLTLQSNTWTVTNDGSTDTGFNNAGVATSSTVVSGTGSGAGIVLNTGAPSWSTQTIDSTDDVGRWTSISVIDTDTIYISYRDDTNADLKFTKSTDGGTSWTTSTIDSTGDVGVDVSISTIDANTIFISYKDYTNADLKFAKSTDGGTSWTTSTVDSMAGGSSNKQYASISAIDANTIFISYYEASSLKFAKSTDGGTSWTISTIDSVNYAGFWNSIHAIDANTIFIGYTNTDPGLRFAKSTDGGTSWTTSTVDTTTKWTEWISITALDANTIFISYADGDLPRDIKFAKSTDGGTSWTISTLDLALQSTGPYTSITVVDANTIFISYYNSYLIFAKSTNGGTSWATSTVDSIFTTGEWTSIIAIDANTIFIGYKYGNNKDLKLATYSAQYLTSGTFTSHAYDTTVNASFGTLSWTETTPANTDITIKARSGNQSNMSDATAWGSCTNITSGADPTTGECVTDTHRYIQFQATFTTSDTSATPTLSDVTVTYNDYPTSAQTLTSSAYDTSDSVSAVGSIVWTETLPTGTDVKFQIRTAPDSSGSPGTWSSWLGPTGTGDYYTAPAGSETINSTHTDGASDQWIQYKVWLNTTDSSITPTLSDITFSYVVNASPELQSVTASQGSGGTVAITYEVRDSDTSSGSATPGYITPSFEYWNGASWVSISTLVSGDTDNKAVNASTFTQYSATWTPTTDYNNQYMSGTAKIRVTVNDNEGANNTANAESATYTLDTKIPASVSVIVKATTTPATLIISVTDDSSLQMKTSLDPALTGASWVTFTTTSTLTLSTDPDTVYIQIKDAYGNTSASTSATTPGTPLNTMVQDTSNINVSPAEYRLFTAWKVVTVPSPGFASYKVYRSTDQSTWTLIKTETDRTINYYSDSSVSESTTYYYRVTTIDSDENISYYSSTVNGKADGVQNAGEGGGGTLDPPVISNIATSSVTTTSATITWDTDTLSNSTVGYSTSASTFTSETNVSSMVDDSSGSGVHSVTLSGLTAGTTYYFQVKSSDVNSSLTTDNNSGPGYVFDTLSGPVISNTATVGATDTTATIQWATDNSSNSKVIYSTNSNLSNSTTVTESAMGTNHSITLSSLTAGTHYYYYVESADANSVTATDKNTIDGVINYYTFTTSVAATALSISNLQVSVVDTESANITWTTNRKASSRVNYGTSQDDLLSNATSTSYKTDHSLSLTGLSGSTKYYYQAVSADADSNYATSSTSSFTTSTKNPTVTVNVGGGGGIIVGVLQYVHDLVLEERDSLKLKVADMEDIILNLEKGISPEDMLRVIVDKAKSITKTISNSFILGKADVIDTESIRESNETLLEVLEEMAKVIPPPILKSEPKIEIFSTFAKIPWDTNEPTNSLIAYASDAEYDETKDDPYTSIAGNSNENVMEHLVILKNLIPLTKYNYKVISQTKLGTETTSSNLTFTTKPPLPKIVESLIQEITTDSVTVTWGTTIPTDSNIIYTNLSTGKSETKGDSKLKLTHEIILEDLEPQVWYSMLIVSKDKNGIEVSESLGTIRTIPDVESPNMSVIRTRNALIPGQSNKVQTIISWKTNEPSTSQIFWNKGMSTTDEFSFKTPLDSSLKEEHIIVLTKFDAGTLYKFRVESTDISGNTAISRIYTILTPRQKEDVAQIILDNFRDIFRWTGIKK